MDATISGSRRRSLTVGNRAKLHLALGVLYLRNRIKPGRNAPSKRPSRGSRSRSRRTPSSGPFYLAKRDSAQAEREFKAAADLAPMGSPARLKLVDFYLSAAEARRGQAILRRRPSRHRLRTRLASPGADRLEERNYDGSLNALQALLKKSPSDLEGHFLQGVYA